MKSTLLAVTLSMLVCGSALAQAPGAMDPAKLAQFGGGMHALAHKCGGYTKVQLDTMKAQQKAEHVKRGMSAAQFDTAFEQGLRESTARYEGASAQQQQQACQQAKMLQSMNLGRIGK